ncbi:MAG TPA: 2OG-Fe(II) oxygenase, partial [Coleofasciculaceae cyanobacterium]
SVAILPVFNRMVIFATDKQSWHGYRRVNTPDGDTRKSINIYYFTEQSPDRSDYYHITSFRARNNEMLHKALYPLDNMVRTMARKVRPQKDNHAVLFNSNKKQ